MRQSYLPRFAAASLSAALLAGCYGGSGWIGLIVADPTGLCYRQDIGRGDAVSFALDLERIDNDVAHFHLDWIRYVPSAYGQDLSLYWGLGAEFASWTGDRPAFVDQADTTYVAARVPLGLELDLAAGSSVLLFLQIVPKVPFEQNTDLHLDAALGLIFGF